MSAIRRLITGADIAFDGEASALLIATAILIISFAVRNRFDYMFGGSMAALFWILVATRIHEMYIARFVT